MPGLPALLTFIFGFKGLFILGFMAPSENAYPSHLTMQIGLARTFLNDGEFEKAGVLLESAIAQLTKIFPQDDIRVLACRSHFLQALQIQKNRKEALIQAEKILLGVEANLQQSLMMNSPVETTFHLIKLRIPLDAILSYLATEDFPEELENLTAQTFCMIEAMRSSWITSTRIKRAIAKNPGMKKLAEEIKKETEQIAVNARSKATREGLNQPLEKRDAATRDLARLLAKETVPILPSLTFSDYASRLSPGEAALTTCAFTRSRLDEQDPQNRYRATHLVSFVITSEGALSAIDLGPESLIEKAVSDFRQGISTSMSGTYHPDKKLRSLVFDPISHAVTRCSRIFLATDDVLRMIPFDALFQGKRLVGDRFEIANLNSLDDLFAPRTRPENPWFISSGGVDYLRIATQGFFRTGVTASELSDLDLTGCRLAVSCDQENQTEDLGRVGSQLLFRRQVLQTAGARATLTSLWKAPDPATREFMILFYRKLFVDRLSLREALWQSKMEVRESRPHPGNWAGWVLTGRDA